MTVDFSDTVHMYTLLESKRKRMSYARIRATLRSFLALLSKSLKANKLSLNIFLFVEKLYAYKRDV